MPTRTFSLRTWLALTLWAGLSCCLLAQTAAAKKQPPEVRWAKEILIKTATLFAPGINGRFIVKVGWRGRVFRRRLRDSNSRKKMAIS